VLGEGTEASPIEISRNLEPDVEAKAANATDGNTRQRSHPKEQLRKAKALQETGHEAMPSKTVSTMGDIPTELQRKATAERCEMERLLQRPAAESMRDLLVLLTENEAHVARLRWEHNWPVAKIARAMNKHRTTIDETLGRAKRKMGARRNRRESSAVKFQTEASAIEDKLIQKIDAEKYKDRSHKLK
jgi:hypothetical protein